MANRPFEWGIATWAAYVDPQPRKWHSNEHWITGLDLGRGLWHVNCIRSNCWLLDVSWSHDAPGILKWHLTPLARRNCVGHWHSASANNIINIYFQLTEEKCWVHQNQKKKLSPQNGPWVSSRFSRSLSRHRNAQYPFQSQALLSKHSQFSRSAILRQVPAAQEFGSLVQVNTQKTKWSWWKMAERSALPEAYGDFLFARKEKAERRVGNNNNESPVYRSAYWWPCPVGPEKQFENLVSKANLFCFFCFLAPTVDHFGIDS